MSELRHFLIGIALDRGGFLRQQCPHCGLDFKIKIDAIDKNDALTWWLQEAMHEATDGASSHDDKQTPKRYCPYCTYAATTQDFVHPEVVDYIRRIVYREIIEPMIAKLFDSIGSGLKSSRFLQITVTRSSGRSVRPISGPEPDDQLPVRCGACADVFKIDERWRGTVGCPSCSVQLVVL